MLTFILRIFIRHLKNEEGAERKCNFENKISCERKRAIFKKIFNEHHIVAIEEHIRVFL
jgi:hypothetical protein